MCANGAILRKRTRELLFLPSGHNNASRDEMKERDSARNREMRSAFFN